MKPTVPTLLSFNGGYVDTVGYVFLQGLFTAHVTGNVVTIGAALVFGTSGIVAKLLALPVFCVVIIVTRLVTFNLPARWPVLVGMTLVSAMAIQNVVHRIHLSAAPPSTLMTGTTTQMMIDIADMVRDGPGASRDAIKSRLRRMGAAVATFAAGAAAGALLFNAICSWCFVLPPVVAFLARLTVKSSLNHLT